MSKLITVFGATGNQGGSVVKHILNDATLSKEFKIRGVTRDTTKPAAQALAKQGVELVSADLNSKDSLRAALHGSHTVFLVTNYWETVSSVTEISQGKNVADVALEAGVQHIIYSSLLNVTRLTNGRLKNVPHFDGKAEVEQYIRDIGLPSTFYLPGFFMSNFSQMVKPDEEGTLTWAVPITDEAKFPLIAIKEDTGKFITAIIKQRDSLLGARILGSENYYPAKDILATIGEVTGKKTKFVQVDDATYKTFLPEFMAQEMLENHLLIQEPGYYGGESLEKSHAVLDQKLTTWKQFVTENKVGA